MTRKERTEIDLDNYRIYAGILFAHPTFSAGEDIRLRYEFNCGEYGELLKKYPIEKVAGKGSDFDRALRLCRYLVPRLKHKGDFHEKIPYNAITLLDYAFEKETGINCVAKAKILQECCLALGIYARRIGMYPLSPYDGDNHVVCEIFDRNFNEWLFLDPTTGGYLSDGKVPLGIIQARKRMASMSPVSVIYRRQTSENIGEIQTKNSGDNAYYAKNMAFFSVDEISTFGDKGGLLWLIPEGFSAEDRFVANMEFRIEWCRRVGEKKLAEMFESASKDMKSKKMKRISAEAFCASPLK